MKSPPLRASLPLMNLILMTLMVLMCTASKASPSPLESFTNDNGTVKLGHSLLPLFLLEEGYINLNHGSFGAPPRSVLEYEQNWTLQMELNPDRWFRYQMYDQVDLARAQMAQYLGVNASDLVFIINASNGVNSVLRSLIYPGGNGTNSKRVLYLNTAYDMVKNTLQFLDSSFGERLLEVNLTFPVTKQSIIDTVVSALEAHPGEIALASFSHITSIPSLILPISELIAECHSRGVLVLIDGAHALGHIPINITQLNPDFYLSNGHKWFYTTKGSAFLWVRPELQHLIYPTVISQEGQGATPFQLDFSWVGTMDYSSFLSFPAALAFRESLGGDSVIFSYMHSLALEGGKLLANSWKSQVLCDNDESLIPAMVNVALPSSVNQTLANELPTLLLLNYNTWVPVFPLNDLFWVRVSAQVYNEISDFQYLADAVLQTIAQNSNAATSA